MEESSNPHSMERAHPIISQNIFDIGPLKHRTILGKALGAN